MTAIGLRSILVVVGTLLLAFPAEAIRFTGEVRDGFTQLPLNGAEVRVVEEGRETAHFRTLLDGHYRIDLSRDRRYEVHFMYQGRLPRHVVIDTRGVPRQLVDSLEGEMHMRLFPPMTGLDPSLLNSPAGMARWDSNVDNLLFDQAWADAQREGWNTAAEDHLRMHPELRPTGRQRQLLVGWDLFKRWGLLVMLVVMLAFFKVLDLVLHRLYGWPHLLFSGLALAGCIALVVWLGDATGPMRYLNIVALPGLYLLVVFAGALFVGRKHRPAVAGMDLFEEDPEPLDEGVMTEAALEDADPQVIKRKQRMDRAYAVAFLVSLIVLFLEIEHLDNTLGVWPWIGLWAAIGAGMAAWVVWLRTEPMLRRFRGLMFWRSIPWMVVGALTMVTTASRVDRSLAKGPETCVTWPVERSAKWVHVRTGEGSERFDVPKSVRSQLTSEDSLRCCIRRGLLGAERVVSFEAVIQDNDVP